MLKAPRRTSSVRRPGPLWFVILTAAIGVPASVIVPQLERQAPRAVEDAMTVGVAFINAQMLSTTSGRPFLTTRAMQIQGVADARITSTSDQSCLVIPLPDVSATAVATAQLNAQGSRVEFRRGLHLNCFTAQQSSAVAYQELMTAARKIHSPITWKRPPLTEQSAVMIN